jgi:putative tricarboxylic transport membrane protein
LRNPDIRLGILLILAAAAWTFVLVPVGISKPGRISTMAVAPDFWPTICGYALMALGLIIAAQGLIRGVTGSEEKAISPDTAGDYLPRPTAALRVCATVAILFAYYLTIEVLGMPLSSALTFVALSVLSGERRYVQIVAIALLLPIALFLFLSRVANVPIPLGITSSLI